jgi:type IV pilus assembly protein PilW
MRSSQYHMRPSDAGFSLIELMVGMAIGLLLVLVITQVMSVFEARNRATMGNADAQTNGAIALYTISRDLQMAGFSLMPEEISPLECATLNFGTTGVTGVAPVVLTNGVTATGVSPSDSITIRYGNSMKGGTLTPITAAPLNGNVTVSNNLGCKVNDMAIITNGTSCTLAQVTGPTDLATPPTASTPPNTTTVTLKYVTAAEKTAADAAVAGANIACLGNWNEITYSANGGNLLRNGTPVLSGIVNLQAQYGISSTANTNQITQWVDASGTWETPSIADRNRIKAVRIAVIARNDKIDTSNVTNACSSVNSASPSGLCSWEGTSTSPAPAVNLSAGDANWQRYRYRVFETIVPLRNVIWSKDTL